MEHVDKIINFIVKNEIFLHLNIRWDHLDSCITEKFLEKQIVRYTPSKKHRKKCKYDLCHKNARLEFIDHKGRLILFKNIRRNEEHRKKCNNDLCHKNARLEFIEYFGCVTNSKSFKDHRTITNFRQKKCIVL